MYLSGNEAKGRIEWWEGNEKGKRRQRIRRDRQTDRDRNETDGPGNYSDMQTGRKGNKTDRIRKINRHTDTVVQGVSVPKVLAQQI